MDFTSKLQDLCEFTIINQRLLNSLLATGHISQVELDCILAKTNGQSQCLELYTTLQRNSQNKRFVWSELLQIFHQNENEEMAKLLAEGEMSDPEAETAGDNSNSNPARMVSWRLPEMELINRKRICKNLEYLANYTSNIETFTIALETLGVLTSSERQYVVSLPSKNHQCIYLFSTLLKKDSTAYDRLLEAAVATGNEHLIEKLCEDVSSEEEPDLELQVERIRYTISQEEYRVIEVQSRIWFDIQEPVVNWTGREAELDDIHKSVCSQRDAITKSISKITVLTGLGGIGKSELARKYAYEKCQASHIVWINCESAGTMQNSFIRLAKFKLGIPEASEDAVIEPNKMNVIVEKVYEYFSQKSCLFIFDNAENCTSEWDQDRIEAFLPILRPRTQRPCILVTSRNEGWEGSSRNHQWETIKVETFTVDESKTFITNILIGETEEDVQKLSFCIKGLPLALNQAVGYIKYMNQNLSNLGESYQIQDYLTEWDENFNSLLKFNPFFRTEEMEFQVTTITWKISINRMIKERDGHLAHNILNILAYFNSEKVSSRLFLHFINDSNILGSVLDLLKRYSFIGIHNGMISMHDLLQEVTQRIALRQGQENIVLQSAFAILECELPKDEKTYDMIFGDGKILLSSSLKAWRYGLNYQELLRRFQRLYLFTIIHCATCGQFKKAEMLSQTWLDEVSDTPAEASCVTKDSDEAESTAIRMKMLIANVNAKLGSGSYNALEVTEILKQCWKYSHLLPIDENNKTDVLARKLVEKLKSVRKEDLGEKLEEAVIEMTRISGPDSVGSMIGTNLVAASLLQEQGNDAEALKCIGESIKGIKLRTNTDISLSSHVEMVKAGFLNDQGKNEEALKIVEALPTEYLDSLVHVQEVAGNSRQFHEKQDSRPELIMLKIYAQILRDAGKLEESLTIYQNLCNRIRKSLGIDHDDFISTSLEMGDITCRIERSRLDPTWSCRKRNELEIYTRVNQGRAMMAHDNYGEAIVHLREVYQNSLVINGPTDRVTTAAGLALIIALEGQGGQVHVIEEALNVSLTVFENYQRALGNEHSSTLEIQEIVNRLISKIDSVM